MTLTSFSIEQVTALCGGRLPYANGFDWNKVEHFLLEEGCLEPYSDGTKLPGPSIKIKIKVHPM